MSLRLPSRQRTYGGSPTSGMTSRTLLELPAEIRNNIYHHVLCYDGVAPEVISARYPGQSRKFCSGLWIAPVRIPCNRFITEQSGLRLQLDVIAPIRSGVYPGVQVPVLASDVLTLLRTCRQIYEEAHHMFWAENTFIFSDQDTLHAFTYRIGEKAFQSIRTFGIEKTVNAEWINVNGGIDLGFWFADVRITPFLQTLHLHGWETRFEEYYCEREHWVPDNSNPLELKIRKFMIPCKTTYNWLRSPWNSQAKPLRANYRAANDRLFDNCALRYSQARRYLIVLDSIENEDEDYQSHTRVVTF